MINFISYLKFFENIFEKRKFEGKKETKLMFLDKKVKFSSI